MNRLKRVVLITALFSGVMHVDNAFGLNNQKLQELQNIIKEAKHPTLYPPQLQMGSQAYKNIMYSNCYILFSPNYFQRVEDAFSYCEDCRWSVDDFLNAIGKREVQCDNGPNYRISNLFTDDGLFYVDNVDQLLVDACEKAFSKFIEGLGIPEGNSLYSLLTHLKKDHETKLDSHKYSVCMGELGERGVFNTLGSLREEIDILVKKNDALTAQLNRLTDPQYGKISPDTIDAFINSGFINPSEFFRIPKNEFKSDWEEFVAKAFTDPVLDVAIENFHKLKTWVASLKQYSEEYAFKSVMDKMPEMCLTYNLEGIAATCNDITRMTFIMMFSGIAEKTRSEQAKCLREKYESLCQEDDEIIPVRALGPDGDNNYGRVVNNDAPVELRLEFNAISSGDESAYAVEEVSEDNFKEEGLC